MSFNPVEVGFRFSWFVLVVVDGGCGWIESVSKCSTKCLKCFCQTYASGAASSCCSSSDLSVGQRDLGWYFCVFLLLNTNNNWSNRKGTQWTITIIKIWIGNGIYNCFFQIIVKRGAINWTFNLVLERVFLCALNFFQQVNKNYGSNGKEELLSLLTTTLIPVQLGALFHRHSFS